jgi:hypothetical protein
MADQLSFASLDFAAEKKRTNRDVFLAEMAAVDRPHHLERGRRRQREPRNAFPLVGPQCRLVMDRLCRRSDGLLPAPKSIELSCSCPDGAHMCKRVAAILYGIGARLDSRPELISRASAAPIAAVGRKRTKSGKVLGDADLSALFGLNIEEPSSPADKEAKAAVETGPRPLSGRHRRKNGPKRADRDMPSHPKRAVTKAKQAKSRTSDHSASTADVRKHSSRKRAASSGLAT